MRPQAPPQPAQPLQQLRFLALELLVREHALFVKLAELFELFHRCRGLESARLGGLRRAGRARPERPVVRRPGRLLLRLRRVRPCAFFAAIAAPPAAAMPSSALASVSSHRHPLLDSIDSIVKRPLLQGMDQVSPSRAPTFAPDRSASLPMTNTDAEARKQVALAPSC